MSASASGLLVVDKPRGPTSHDVVAQARRLFDTRSVGHAGTLDPAATGVLLVLVGEATKLAAHLTLEDKRYRAVVQFGRSTDSGDAQGTTTDETPLANGWLRATDLSAALDAELLRREQVPPALSAININGERAHRLARQGRPPTLEPRAVRVRELRVVLCEEAALTLEITVSKGYYVRSLARDLGERLGTPAHLADLRRVASGPFTDDEAVSWPTAERPPLLSLSTVVRRCLAIARVTQEGARRARLGQRLGPEHFVTDGLAAPAAARAEEGRVSAWLGPDGSLVALGEPRDDGYAVLRGFSAS